MKLFKLLTYNIFAFFAICIVLYCGCQLIGIDINEITIQNVLIVISILLTLNVYWQRRSLSPLKIEFNCVPHDGELNLKIDFINLSSFDIKINDIEISGYSNLITPMIIQKESTKSQELLFKLIEDYPNKNLIIKYQMLGLKNRKTLKRRIDG